MADGNLNVNEIASKAVAAGLTDPKHVVAFTLGFTSANKKVAAKSKPKMHYFPLAGRGELIRLIAAAGGVELEESNERPSDLATYGSPSSMPVLSDGPLRMAQSGAIERYVSDISPKFAGLTAQQRAVDSMFGAIKEDMLGVCAKIAFGDRSKAPEELPKILGRWLTVLEGRIPANGFINGLAFPTAADCAVLNIRSAYMLFGATYKLAGDEGGTKCFAKYPKINALAKRTSEADGVKQYLASSKSFSLPGFGL